jgi:hypothetical protein
MTKPTVLVKNSYLLQESDFEKIRKEVKEKSGEKSSSDGSSLIKKAYVYPASI